MHPWQQVDIAFEQVDMIDLARNAAVKGVESEPQQPALLALRKLGASSEQYVLLAEEHNVVQRLRGVLPVVIEGGEEWEAAAEELDGERDLSCCNFVFFSF